MKKKQHKFLVCCFVRVCGWKDLNYPYKRIRNSQKECERVLGFIIFLVLKSQSVTVPQPNAKPEPKESYLISYDCHM